MAFLNSNSYVCKMQIKLIVTLWRLNVLTYIVTYTEWILHKSNQLSPIISRYKNDRNQLCWENEHSGDWSLGFKVTLNSHTKEFRWVRFHEVSRIFLMQHWSKSVCSTMAKSDTVTCQCHILSIGIIRAKRVQPQNKMHYWISYFADNDR